MVTTPKRPLRPGATATAAAVALAATIVVAIAALPRAARGAGDANTTTPSWLGDDLPLPLSVKTPQDIAFKAATERQYLIFNLMAGGKWAFQHGDYAVAIEKWEALLKTPQLDREVERVVTPSLAEARRRAKAAASAAGKTERAPAAEPAGTGTSTATSTSTSTNTSTGTMGMTVLPVKAVRPPDGRVSVSGSVSGGGEAGPGGAVVWLRRLDGPTPKVAPAVGRFITQKDKTFMPHVLAVPLGTTVEFRNEDRIYHNVFSLNKPNDFDAGIRAAGSTYSRTFTKAGPVELLCNIHSTMSAYVVVVDTPYFTKTRPSGTFMIRGVVPGRYEVAVWHEAASEIVKRTAIVTPDGATGIVLSVGGDKRPGAFVPDKYGHKRQPHLGY